MAGDAEDASAAGAALRRSHENTMILLALCIVLVFLMFGLGIRLGQKCPMGNAEMEMPDSESQAPAAGSQDGAPV
jgi:hypothetical protein